MDGLPDTDQRIRAAGVSLEARCWGAPPDRAPTLVLLHEGKIVQQGSAQDLLNAPAGDFVRKFLKAQRVPPGAVR